MAAAGGSSVTTSWAVRCRPASVSCARGRARRRTAPPAHGPVAGTGGPGRRSRTGREGRRPPRPSPCAPPARPPASPAAVGPRLPRPTAPPAARRRGSRGGHRRAAWSPRRSPAPTVNATRPSACAAPSSAATNAGTAPLPRSADASPQSTHAASAARAAIARGHRRARQSGWRVDPDGTVRADGQCLAQPGDRAGPADGHDRHGVAPRLGQSESDLERGPIRLGHAGPPLVAVGGDPLPADDDHDRRNTTPWPPSGYDHAIAPSRLHTR